MKKMSRQHRPRTSLHQHETGNHNLITIVVALVAVLAALSIYVLVYQKHRPTSSTKIPTDTAAITNSATTGDTPTQRTIFVGVVKSIGEDSVNVATAVTKNGATNVVMVKVSITSSTDIETLGPAPVGIPTENTNTQSRTASTIHDFKVGQSVEVTSVETVDGATSVTASKIDILSTSI